jgi:hypothetical protein
MAARRAGCWWAAGQYDVLELIWRKRRYRCAQPRCAQQVFTERSAQVPPRGVG